MAAKPATLAAGNFRCQTGFQPNDGRDFLQLVQIFVTKPGNQPPLFIHASVGAMGVPKDQIVIYPRPSIHLGRELHREGLVMLHLFTHPALRGYNAVLLLQCNCNNRIAFHDV